ncbi:hypothetical protein [Pedococcus bigeumensis]|nr:hypothetical protein [Pedococcus bigeumensis]
MMNRSQARLAARLVMAGVATGLACLSSTGTAGAATLPDPLGAAHSAPASGSDPLGGALTGTTATVGHLLGATATPPPGLPSGQPSGLPALPAAPGQTPAGGSQGDSGASADAQAPSGDNLAAVDAAVANFLGVCVRVPHDVVPIQADIVVLDRNLITELVDAGVPLQKLVVPCPKGAAVAPPTGGVPAGPAACVRPTRSGLSASALPASLAFTGTDVAPTLLLAGGLLALGLAFLRKARMLVEVRED